MALELIAQLAIVPADDRAAGISASEVAATVVRTLSFPAMRSRRFTEAQMWYLEDRSGFNLG
jgi:hypothetical protein